MRDLKEMGSFWRGQWLLVAALSLCVLFLLRSRYELTIVVGRSMRPTLRPGELLVVDKRAYVAKEPARDDLVVAHYRNDLVVKRVVGLPGEEVEVKQGALYINGRPYPETHRVEPGPLDIRRGTLMRGSFATLGDNRSIPRDQAVHPILSKKNIVGKVVISLAL